jgi:cystathionine gamma-synthase
VSQVVQRWGSEKDQEALIFPTREIAKRCEDYVLDYCKSKHQPYFNMISTEKILMEFEISWSLTGHDASLQIISLISSETSQHQEKRTSIHAVLFATSTAPHAMKFWMHTGEGISSRRAEYCLSIFDSYRILDNAGWSDAIAFSGTKLETEGTVDKNEIRKNVSALISTSETTVAASNVFLYATGMKAIYDTYRALLLVHETRKVG